MKEISEERIEKLKRLVIDVDDSYLSSDEKSDIVCLLDRSIVAASLPILIPKDPEQPIGYPGQPQVWYNKGMPNPGAVGATEITCGGPNSPVDGHLPD